MTAIRSNPEDVTFSAIQNSALGAVILWEFCLHYEKEKQAGPTLLLVMPILPLIFNAHATSAIFKRKMSGGLFRAINEDRSLVAGLQSRMVKMADQTFESINLGLASGLIGYDSESAKLATIRKSVPDGFDYSDAENMRFAAKRLGIWFADLPIDQLSFMLNLRF